MLFLKDDLSRCVELRDKTQSKESKQNHEERFICYILIFCLLGKFEVVSEKMTFFLNCVNWGLTIIFLCVLCICYEVLDSSVLKIRPGALFLFNKQQ